MRTATDIQERQRAAIVVSDAMVQAAADEAERQNLLLSYRVIRRLLETAMEARDGL